MELGSKFWNTMIRLGYGDRSIGFLLILTQDFVRQYLHIYITVQHLTRWSYPEWLVQITFLHTIHNLMDIFTETIQVQYLA